MSSQLNDVVGASDQITHVYRQYLESAFPLRYAELGRRREQLLAEPGVLHQPLLVEPVPVYASSDRTLSRAADELARLTGQPVYVDLPHLAGRLLPPTADLHAHQWNSLERTVNGGKDLVVTTGTGSGKTECFLLPLLAELVRESAAWPAADPRPDDWRWWEKGNRTVSQCGYMDRPAAVRALVLYPLNALVEDQLRRLRGCLDHPDAHAWLDADRGGNRITFGRYTGSTPVPGDQQQDWNTKNKPKHARLRENAKRMAEEAERVAEAAGQNPELLTYWPRIDGGEMWSRWDMQRTPPDVLITNHSMLNIMLMRSVEASIFDKTRDWLRGDPDARFHLIVDELHSYRGTPGTEVAYLLRQVLDRLGLSPDSPQLRILTTSASFGDGRESADRFLGEFFGRSPGAFHFEAGAQATLEGTDAAALRPHAAALSAFADADEAGRPAAQNVLAQALAADVQVNGDPPRSLAEALARVDAARTLRAACNANGTPQAPDVRATPLPELEEDLFHGDARATRGLLLALATARTPADTSPQPVRGHLFAAALQNLWACTNASCGVNAGVADGAVPPVGALYHTHTLTCDDCGRRTLDLIVCEVCGDVMLGGHVHAADDGGGTLVLSNDPAGLEAMPDRAAGSVDAGNYRVLWPQPHSRTPADPNYNWKENGQPRQCSWNPKSFHPATGELYASTGLPDGSRQVWAYAVNGGKGSPPAMPPICPCCDADYRKRKKGTPTPLRNHRPGFQKVAQVLASSVVRELPLTEGERETPARKLVVFSDSRQESAKLAAGLERDHFRDMLRVLLMRSIRERSRGIEAFVRHVAAMNPAARVNLEQINPRLADPLGQPAADTDAADVARLQAEDGSLANAVMLVALGVAGVPDEARARENLRRYPGRLGLTQVRDDVFTRLASLGTCPGGTEASMQRFNDAGGERRFNYIDWHECFDWSGPAPIPRTDNADVKEHLSKMRGELMAELMFVLFPHVTRTFESLGLGVVEFDMPNVTSEAERGVMTAIVRQRAIKRRYPSSGTFIQDGGTPQLPRDIVTFLGTDLPDPMQAMVILAGLTTPSLVLRGSRNTDLGINPDRLVIDLGGFERDDAGDPLGWSCAACGGFYARRGNGRCVMCVDKPLVQGRGQTARDYYQYLADDSGEPFRFRVEELTGQTDAEDRPRRQRRFQEVFVEGDGPTRVAGIDLLSVTTTMEAGVDIGGLSAVMMSNVPPERFNYQQRVGRAGRRGLGVSLAVTACRGRSHDQHYYQNTKSITGDRPPDPYLDTSAEPIFDRCLNKEAMRLAFRGCNLGGPQIGQPGDTHGEFDLVADWPGHAEAVGEWLAADQNQEKLRHAAAILRRGTAVSEPHAEEAVRSLRETLRARIDAVVIGAADQQAGLAETLANAGLLPMFGFPTRVRLLYTKMPKATGDWPPKNGVVDRELELAIGQFAPGSETVKDKRVHRAAALVAPFRAGYNQLDARPGLFPPLAQPNALTGVCESCRAVAVFDDLPPGRVLAAAPPMSNEDCDTCGSTASVRVMDAREPTGFMTDLGPRDFDGVFDFQPYGTQPALFYDGGELPPVGQDVANATGHVFAGKIFSINDNGGKGGFDLTPVSIEGNFGGNAYAAMGALRDSPKFAADKFVALGQPAQRVALVSRRRTDVLLAGVRRMPEGIAADPTTPTGRAAWISFAFYLRRRAADLLDVQPSELDAGMLPWKAGDEPLTGRAFLADSLANGAGFCKRLAEPDQWQALMTSTANVHGEAAPCDSSCVTCLRDFYNMAYHGLLDWRLALDVLALAAEDRPPSLDEPAGASPWGPTLAVGGPIDTALRALGYEAVRETGGRVTAWHPPQQTTNAAWLVPGHPLWTKEHPQWRQWAVEAEDAGAPQVDLLDPFLALRRPSKPGR